MDRKRLDQTRRTCRACRCRHRLLHRHFGLPGRPVGQGDRDRGRCRPCSIAPGMTSALFNVQMIEGDGTSVPFDAADVIYVNAGVTVAGRSLARRIAGRRTLGFADDGTMADDPANATSGAVFRIERRMSEFMVRCISPVRIIPCTRTRRDIASGTAEAFTSATANGSPGCTGAMTMSPTTVAGFAAPDGASPTT